MYEHPHTDTDSARELAKLRAMHTALAHGISHDLRAPLRVIDGFSQQLEHAEGLTQDATAHAQVRRIRDASARMSLLIDQLLEYLRADSIELRPQQVDLSLLADWSGAELCDEQPDRPARIDVSDGLWAWGDERQYKVMFDQLLRNAWRFSEDCEEVRIEVDGQREDDRLLLNVRDHGCGFDPKYAERVFEPFQRLHGTGHGGGNGLGLSIVRAIVERQGGHVSAESEPGKGACIHLELPAAAPVSDTEALAQDTAGS